MTRSWRLSLLKLCHSPIDCAFLVANCERIETWTPKKLQNTRAHSAMTLFKFCNGTGGAAILKERSVFITSPLDLNDPFEMRPAWTDAHAKRHHDDQETRNRKFAGKPMFVAMSDGLRPSGRTPLLKEPAVTPVENQLGIADMHNERVFRTLHDQYRVLSFSTGVLDVERSHDVSDKDTLMWAHYADSFQGICIGLDPAKFENGIRPGGFEVDYSPTRATLPPSHYDSGQGFQKERINHEGAVCERDPESGLFLMPHNREETLRDHFLDLLKKKSPAWEYEQEVRMIYDLGSFRETETYCRPEFACEDCQRARITHHQCKHTKTYRDALRLPPEAVVTVIFGSDVSSADASAILNILAAPDFEHVEIYWSSLHSEKYVLQYNRDHMTNGARFSLFMQGLREEQTAKAKGHVRYDETEFTHVPSKKTINYVGK
jgi:hypothetical protein